MVCGCVGSAARAVSSAPRFVERLQNQTVREGDPVAFTVDAVGVPAPMLGWAKDGRSVPGAGGGDDRYRVETDGARSTLAIAAARPDDNAWFQCTAASVAGTAVNRARLVVQGNSYVPLHGPDPTRPDRTRPDTHTHTHVRRHARTRV